MLLSAKLYNLYFYTVFLWKQKSPILKIVVATKTNICVNLNYSHWQKSEHQTWADLSFGHLGDRQRDVSGIDRGRKIWTWNPSLTADNLGGGVNLYTYGPIFTLFISQQSLLQETENKQNNISGILYSCSNAWKCEVMVDFGLFLYTP